MQLFSPSVKGTRDFKRLDPDYHEGPNPGLDSLPMDGGPPDNLPGRKGDGN
jgi:hypothetical protein